MNIIPEKTKLGRKVVYNACYGFKICKNKLFEPLVYSNTSKRRLARNVKEFIKQHIKQHGPNPSYEDFLGRSTEC